MLLGYMILGLAILAAWHFIIDGILAPSALVLTQVRLLKTHRDINSMGQSKVVKLDPKVCHVLRDSTESLGKHIGAYNIVTLYRMTRRFRRDPSFQRQVAHQIEILEGANLPEVQQVKDRLQDFANQALCWNSLGWLIYVPVLLVVVGAYNWISRMLKALIALPEYQWDKFDRGLGNPTSFGNGRKFT